MNPTQALIDCNINTIKLSDFACPLSPLHDLVLCCSDQLHVIYNIWPDYVCTDSMGPHVYA